MMKKGVKSVNFCYRKVVRAITKCGAIEKIRYFDRVLKFILPGII